MWFVSVFSDLKENQNHSDEENKAIEKASNAQTNSSIGQTKAEFLEIKKGTFDFTHVLFFFLVPNSTSIIPKRKYRLKRQAVLSTRI